nr:MAG: hypothetical protein [Microvirus sp.]
MAYRSRRAPSRRRSTGRSRPASRGRSYGKRASSYARRGSARRSSGRNTLRLEIVTTPGNAVSRPDMIGLRPADPPKTKPTF